MPLIKCPDCHTDVSDKAAACPHCGHPIAGYGPSDLAATVQPKKTNRGCAALAVLLFVGLIIVLASGNSESEKEKANPTCKSDWRRCADNADLVNHYDGVISAQTSCQWEAKKLAKYGEPKFPFLAFSSFYTGNAYVKTGIAVFIEKDAKQVLDASVNQN
jgi:hypothetical protein